MYNVSICHKSLKTINTCLNTSLLFLCAVDQTTVHLIDSWNGLSTAALNVELLRPPTRYKTSPPFVRTVSTSLKQNFFAVFVARLVTSSQGEGGDRTLLQRIGPCSSQSLICLLGLRVQLMGKRREERKWDAWEMLGTLCLSTSLILLRFYPFYFIYFWFF